MSDNAKLNAALADTLVHLRDVSVRDGIQSWDANKWKIDDVLKVVGQLDTLAVAVKQELGVDMPPIEAWGGGQVAQPAKFLHEDPLINLEKIHDAAPHLQLQCLYRGRQGFGFIPISNEIQNSAIEAAAKRGVKVFRIFDMMNDLENVSTGIDVVNRYKKEHPEAGVVVEGAISYISEPEGGKRAWTLPEYADYAVKLARKGSDEIVIKNYAGVGDAEMPDLIRAIRGKLDEAGFKGMKINLHTHGAKTPVLKAALAAGADKVDVAIGELSDGPSHSNMRNTIYALLQDKGFTQEEVAAHPVMQQLAKVEETIANIVHRRTVTELATGAKTSSSFDDMRAPLKKLKQEDIERYRMAGGAFSDLSARCIAECRNNKIEAEQLFLKVLENATGLWEKAGRFNTVTPGAKILVDQASAITLKKDKYHKPLTMKDYTAEYMNVATGRFGTNQGMEKGIGDVNWRDAVLMYRTLEMLNKAIANKDVSKEERDLLLGKAAIGKDGSRIVSMPNGTLKLDDKRLEEILMTQDQTMLAKHGKTTIERFRSAVADSGISEPLKKQMLFELTPGRAPNPTAGIAEGKKILESVGINSQTLQDARRPLSGEEDMALLAMLLRNRKRDGSPDDSILQNLILHHAVVPLHAGQLNVEKEGGISMTGGNR